MSSVDSGGRMPQTTVEEDHNSSDTESGSSYLGSGALDTPSCPYQTFLFCGYECSRYFDCPTHLVERSTGEYGSDGAGPNDEHARGDDALVAERDGGVLAAGMGRDELSVLDGTAHSDTGSSARSSLRSVNISSLQVASGAPVAEQDGSRPASNITLQEALNETTESLDQISTHEEPPAGNSVDEGPSEPAESRLGTTSQPMVRPHSGVNPIAPAFAPPGQRRAPPEFIVPRWQPDAEVTYCPICRTQFSIFVRKHHCRKCGRVVCNACSPHRIILPHPFIVRPPGERTYYPSLPFLGSEDGMAEFNIPGGGERVRLCNPCVPDPNTSPPQPQQSPDPYFSGSSHRRTQSSSSSIFGAENRSSSLSPLYPLSSAVDAYVRNRSATLDVGLPSLWDPSPNNGARNHATIYRPQHFSQYDRQSSTLPPRSMVASMASRVPRDLSSFFDLAHASSSSSSMAAMNRPLPPPPQIPEEDECPICHNELPSRTLPNFESIRELHITSCITAHSSYRPRPIAGSGSGNHGTPPPRTARRTGMFPYLATEKDCVDSAECTICLEEFEVGVPMARLECLCRFHRSCINEWFVDHPGRCPVHQHDSFGY